MMNTRICHAGFGHTGRISSKPTGRRRAVVAVQVAIGLTVLVGMAALTFDLGVIYNTRQDLQRAADSSALAAAAMLSEYGHGDPEDPIDPTALAAQAAIDYVEKNFVFGRQLTLDPLEDITFVKVAFDLMVQIVDDLDSEDKMSLEIYGTIARHEIDLTTTYSDVGERLMNMQAGHYDGWTNMGGGIERAVEELTSDRARGTSRKMIVLLTDGRANVNRSGGTGDYSGGPIYALEEAHNAADMGFKIFAVSVGAGSDQSLMEQIADIGGGEHFHAEGSIEEYTDELADIFRRLGGKRSVELIR